MSYHQYVIKKHIQFKYPFFKMHFKLYETRRTLFIILYTREILLKMKSTVAVVRKVQLV